MDNLGICNEKGLLEGVVVLDLSRVLAGPYCGALLADMGATVIKVENPSGGDDSRRSVPVLNGQSVYYINYNRSKYGCTLNLKEPEGKEIFKEMVKKADVVLENYRPGTMEKLGLGYDVLKEINPGIIYASVSGYGHTGPYSRRAGYDVIGQAAGGLMSVTGWPDGYPTRAGTPIGDVLGGLNTAVGLLAALVNKQKTGLGEKVDIALADAVASAMTNVNMIYQATGRVPQRVGNKYDTMCPCDSYPTKDGFIIISCGNNKLYHLLCDAMERPDLKTDEKYLELRDRIAHRDEMTQIVSDWTSQFGTEELDVKLNNLGIPASPVNTVDMLVKDPQIAGAREMFPEIDQPGIGKLQITAEPQKLTRTKSYPRKPAPQLGEDNEKIYKAFLGYGDEELSRLKAAGVI